MYRYAGRYLITFLVIAGVLFLLDLIGLVEV